MKLAQVKIGAHYTTQVSGKEVEVKVLCMTKDYWSNRKKFKVARVDNGKVLIKLRSAAVLHGDD
jgi:archaellum component FlaF (FlaF/FlaG flagellin family)